MLTGALSLAELKIRLFRGGDWWWIEAKEVVAVIQASHDGGTNQGSNRGVLKNGQVLFDGGANRIS